MAEKKKVLNANIVDEDELVDLTFREWLSAKADKVFTDNIPIASIKDMGGTYMYIGGALAYCFFFACFMYFAWTGYVQARGARVISLEDDPDNGDCENVFRNINGQWLASSDGLFSGDINFRYPEAKYSLEFQNFQGTLEKYKSVMDNYQNQLEVLGAAALTQDLADNILTWITWQILEREDGEVRRFQMIADATSVFNNQYIFGQISTVENECYVPTSSSSFDTANGVLQNVYSYSDFKSNPNCSTINPTLFGYDERFHGDTFTVGLDVAAAVTALAVNKNILETSNLELIPSGLEGEPDYVEPPVVMRIDSRIPGMDPIYCIEQGYAEEDIVCVLKMGNMFVVPVYNHFGDLNTNKECDCADMNPYCHVFDFMIGVLYYPYNVTEGTNVTEGINATTDTITGELESFYLLKSLIDIRPFSETNQLAYNASHASVTDKLWETPMFHEQEWRENAYEFCKIDGNYCNIAMFNSYDYDNSFLSSFYYNLPRGSCADSFTADNWASLENNPPIGLVEEYFQCVPTAIQAIFMVVGIAAGNCAAFVPLVMVVVLPFVGFYLQMTGQAPKKPEYEDEQLEAANRALALFILRVRDNKLRGIKNKGVIKQLSEEMVETAKLESGFADSDDDNESDEDDVVENPQPRKPRRRSSVVVGAHNNDRRPQKRSSVTFSAYRRDSNLHSTKQVEIDESTKGRKGMELTKLKKQDIFVLKGIDVHVLNGTKAKSTTTCAPFFTTTSAVSALHTEVAVLRKGMTAVENTLGQKEKKVSRAEFRDITSKISVFSDISMTDLEKEYSSNPQCIVALFKELHSLLLSHFEVVCFLASNKEKEEKLVPAYTVSEYVFSIHDLHKVFTGASSPQNVGTPVSNCPV